MNGKIYKIFGSRLLVMAIGIGALLSTPGCNKALEMDSSHLIGEENQWSTVTDARSSLMGIFGLFRAAIASNNGHWMWGEMREGDFQAVIKQELKAINESKLNTAYESVNDLKSWRRFYAVINSASLFIENAPKILERDPLYTENNLKIDVAQARVMRALTYFYMSRIWGDVPLLTRAFDNGKFEERGVSKQDEVLAFAEREILAVVTDLEYKYGANNQVYHGYTWDRWNGVLITKNTAYTILAHIAAWRGNYIDVEVYTKFVVDRYKESNIDYVGTNNLVAAGGFFNDKNPNQILAFNFVYMHGESTVEGHLESMTLAYPLVQKERPDIFVPKDTIVEAFNDPRNRDVRFGLDTLSGLFRTNYFTNYSSTTPIFSKIKVIRGGTTDGDFAVFGSAIVLSRLEDVVLLRAEALAVLNRDNEALENLNNIRQRRSLPAIITRSKRELIGEIFAERRRELMGEGHRWYDQVRMNKLINENPKIVQWIANGGIYWPIAEEVLESNMKLQQNSYWK